MNNHPGVGGVASTSRRGAAAGSGYSRSARGRAGPAALSLARCRRALLEPWHRKRRRGHHPATPPRRSARILAPSAATTVTEAPRRFTCRRTRRAPWLPGDNAHFGISFSPRHQRLPQASPAAKRCFKIQRDVPLQSPRQTNAPSDGTCEGSPCPCGGIALTLLTPRAPALAPALPPAVAAPGLPHTAVSPCPGPTGAPRGCGEVRDRESGCCWLCAFR
ncbi:uncharacterized protein LOC125328052 [Corvus hawaiiensis]|uniref:uncharacterized protein LOC125328052 n=1 Tax=Corvus hawaiiensis TaxID=134902 RepID=UPI0020193E94|nr:uncharacterized protein LOC125328052 [Corvus hawaiiensis]